ncbi:MAG: inositol monophosphatase family protein [Actinomycetota bacterium]|nr:inositol monophosphatase family protein [Actinomycetota bacterium]
MGAEDESDEQLLTSLADVADAISLPAFRNGAYRGWAKRDGTPVTEVDVAVEQAIRDACRRARPADGFLGEELGPSAGTGRRRWIVDGIDGTAAFIDDRPEWSTLIALADGTRMLAGVATAPALARRWLALADGGAWLVAPDADPPPERLAVSTGDDLVRARVAAWPPSADERLRVGTRPSWGHGVPNGATLVAMGTLDAFVVFGGGPWDHAAPSLLVSEAGGRFTNLDGVATIDGPGGVYSNGRIHDDLVAHLATDPR